MLPESFGLDKIFELPREESKSESFFSSWSESESSYNKYECNLVSIIAYYGFHYMALIKFNKSWYLCEDTKHKKIGSFTDMQEYMFKNKLIPYWVFYDCVYSKVRWLLS